MNSAGRDPQQGSKQDPQRDPQWELVRAAARKPVATPPDLIARVLRSVHGLRGKLLRESIRLPMEGGHLRVDERALITLTRQLGTDIGHAIGGIHISAVSLEADGLQVLATVRYGVAASQVASTLQRRLTAELTAQLGTEPPTVHIHVVDVHPS